MRALLRRSEALARNAKLEAGVLSLGGLSIDPIAREARVDGQSVELTPREFDLLYFFARQPGQGVLAARSTQPGLGLSA
ncbi:response regulator receiver [Alicycliphilus sp. B1]|nr:response regulator receiver [Alicycliphilus sp. B1]